MDSKEMFYKYGGNPYLMEKSGMYEKYKEFNISVQQEYLWRLEYLKKILEIQEITSSNLSQYCNGCQIADCIKDKTMILEYIVFPFKSMNPNSYESILLAIKYSYELSRVHLNNKRITNKDLGDILIRFLCWKNEYLKNIQEYSENLDFVFPYTNIDDIYKQINRLEDLWSGLKND